MGPCPTPTRHAPPPKVLRTPGPQKRARQIQGGLTRAEGWGPFFRLQRPFFVPLSPGSKGQPLQGHSHQSRAWAENVRLFID